MRNGIALAATFLALLPFAASADETAAWSDGAYVGLTAGLARGDSALNFDDKYWELEDAYGDVTGHTLAYAVGAEAGYNWVRGNFLVGTEVDLSHIGFNTSDSDSHVGEYDPGERAIIGQKVSMLSTARLRAGYIHQNVAFYATGGFALSMNDVTMVDGASDGNSKTRDRVWAPGWVAGVGSECAMSEHWTSKIEYLHVATSQKAGTTERSEGETFHSTAKFNAHILRVGLNYRF